MESTNENGTDKAAEVMIAADGIHLIEEFAMVHVNNLAVRLEKEYGRRLKEAGFDKVDYFAIAERFTQSLIDRFNARREPLKREKDEAELLELSAETA